MQQALRPAAARPPTASPPLAPRRRLPPGTDPRSVDYRVDPARAAPFYQAIRAYLPGLPDGALQPAYSGVRSKVGGRQALRQRQRAWAALTGAHMQAPCGT